jgi:hypothetical protein
MDLKGFKEEKSHDWELALNYWGQFGIRHAIYYLMTIEGKDQQDTDRYSKQFVKEKIFSHRLDRDIGFFQMVQHEVLNKPSLWKHIEEITDMVMLDLLYPGKSTMKNANTLFKAISQPIGKSPIPQRKQYRITREYYPELFLISPEGTTPKDGREVEYSSIFRIIQNDDPRLLGAMALIYESERNLIPDITAYHTMVELNSTLRLINPDDVIALSRFTKHVKHSVEKMSDELKSPTGENAWIAQDIRKRLNVTEMFYQLIFTAVALRWFREKRPEVQDRLIKTYMPFKITKEMAKRAVEMTLEWFEEVRVAADHMLRGANGLCWAGMVKESIFLMETSLQILKMDKVDVALYHHSLACSYGQLKMPKKMFSEIMMANGLWEELGRFWDVAITWGYFAEAYHLWNKIDKYNEAKTKSMKLMTDPRLDDYQKARGFLYLADSAWRRKDVDWERQALTTGMDHAAELPDPELYLYLSQCILSMNMGRDSRIMDFLGEGISHPPEFLTYRPIPTVFIPIVSDRKKKEK